MKAATGPSLRDFADRLVARKGDKNPPRDGLRVRNGQRLQQSRRDGPRVEKPNQTFDIPQSRRDGLIQRIPIMNHHEVLGKILDSGVVAVIRMKDRKKLLKVIEAIREGGVQCIEITMTVPNAVEIIRELSGSAPKDVIIGAGTVTDAKTAADVIKAGAKFVVGPVAHMDIIKLCKESGVVVMPGCFTPTEIFAAWKAGADVIKVFPATSLGPKYFKDIAGPFPDIRLMPTGGVTIDNVGEWVKAGAVAVGIGSDLLDKKAIEEERYDVLTDRARRMVRNFKEAKPG